MVVAAATMVARTVRDRINGREFRTARALLRAADTGPIDVLYLGDSMNYSFNQTGDTRTLGEMLTDELRPSLSVFAVVGGGYHPGVWKAFLDLLLPDRPPRVIVHGVSGRLPLAPWALHPLYHYQQQIAVLEAVAAGASQRRLRGGFPPPSKIEMAEYQTLRHTSLLGDLSVGEYLSRVRSTSGQPQEQARWLYAFHHSALVSSESPGIPALLRLADTFARHDLRVVAYLGPVCLPTGVELLGEDLDRVVHTNFEVLEGLYRAHMSERTEILPLTDEFEVSEFLNPLDGTEHLNGAGRARLAHLMAGGIRRVLSDQYSRGDADEAADRR